jgi:Tol biopolymer transport system component/imidazolonepropionase-like amidohydrolase
MAAALSPDGKTIAIDLLGTLWTMPATGGTATPITDIWMDARQPSWSPDGRRIAFQAYGSSTWQIWTVDADGRDLKALTSGPWDDREPTWSPDGGRIAFSSDRGNGNYDIWVLTLGTGELRQVTSDPSNEFMPSWRTDSSEIAFVSDRRGKPGIYAVPIRQGTGARLVAASDGAVSGPAWSRDGATVAFAVASGSHSRLMVGGRNIADADEDVFPFHPQWVSANELLYTADGKIKRRSVTGGPPTLVEFTADVSFTRPAFTPKHPAVPVTGTQPVRGIMHPAISPDGRQIVFAALGDLWLMTVGGTPQRITHDPFVETDPMWSPDGKSILYSCDRDGSMDLWIRDMAAGVDRKLAPFAMNGAWSPDGKRVAFINADEEIAVVQVQAGSSSDIKKVHDRLNEPGRPSWEPDGRAVVVSSLKVYSTRFREGTNQVLRISLDGEPDRWFEPLPHKSIGMREDYGPVWAADGSQMAAIVDGRLAVWPVARDGAPIGALRILSADLANTPTWTGDSRHILYQADDNLRLVDTIDGRVQEIDPHLSYAAGSFRAASAGRALVHAGHLWDGRSDSLRDNVDIVIEGSHVSSVVAHRDDLHTGTVIDASHETVIPGLIEIHSHLAKSFGEALGRIWLAWGITTVRDPAGDPFETIEDREAIESGVRIGPRIVATGDPFDGTRVYYPGGTSLDGGAEVAEQLLRAKRLNYDFIKTYVRLPDLVQARVIEEAHRMGMPVTSHELYPAVAFGADGVEHIRGTSRRGYSPKVTALNRTYRDVIDLLAASKMTLTPTVGIQGGFQLQTLRDASWLDDPRMKLYPPKTLQPARALLAQPHAPAEIEERAALVRRLEQTVFNVVRAGGRVTAGTDAPINPYGLSLLMELEEYVSGGLTPLEALRTATSVSAEAIGMGADLGTIEPGKLADLDIVDGNPLTNIKDLRRVKRVIKGGEAFDLETLMHFPKL